eukprot:snap_masked-scaffold_35-processed-gene-2.16-mRNA-1 protein AED:1.00 eAED:1.00 QI:0/-1/0/0/-1/1/1/0/1725
MHMTWRDENENLGFHEFPHHLLNFSYQKETERGLLTLARGLDYSKIRRCLDFRDWKITKKVLQDTVKHLQIASGKESSPRILSFERCLLFIDQAQLFEILLSSLDLWKDLHGIYFGQQLTQSSTFVAFVQAFCQNNGKNLKYLSLNGSSITDLELQVINLCENLRFFDLSSCSKVTDQGLYDLHGLVNLQELKIASCKRIKGYFSLEPGESIILHRKPLLRLCLSGCELLTDKALMILTASYGKTLIRLDISYCKNVSGLGLRYIYANSSSIQYLNLEHCKSIKHDQLLTDLKKMESLQYINLSSLSFYLTLSEIYDLLQRFINIEAFICKQVEEPTINQCLTFKRRRKEINMGNLCKLKILTIFETRSFFKLERESQIFKILILNATQLVELCCHSEIVQADDIFVALERHNLLKKLSLLNFFSINSQNLRTLVCCRFFLHSLDILDLSIDRIKATFKSHGHQKIKRDRFVQSDVHSLFQNSQSLTTIIVTGRTKLLIPTIIFQRKPINVSINRFNLIRNWQTTRLLQFLPRLLGSTQSAARFIEKDIHVTYIEGCLKDLQEITEREFNDSLFQSRFQLEKVSIKKIKSLWLQFKSKPKNTFKYILLKRRKITHSAAIRIRDFVLRRWSIRAINSFLLRNNKAFYIQRLFHVGRVLRNLENYNKEFQCSIVLNKSFKKYLYRISKEYQQYKTILCIIRTKTYFILDLKKNCFKYKKLFFQRRNKVIQPICITPSRKSVIEVNNEEKHKSHMLRKEVRIKYTMLVELRQRLLKLTEETLQRERMEWVKKSQLNFENAKLIQRKWRWKKVFVDTKYKVKKETKQKIDTKTSFQTRKVTLIQSFIRRKLVWEKKNCFESCLNTQRSMLRNCSTINQKQIIDFKNKLTEVVEKLHAARMKDVTSSGKHKNETEISSLENLSILTRQPAKQCKNQRLSFSEKISTIFQTLVKFCVKITSAPNILDQQRYLIFQLPRKLLSRINVDGVVHQVCQLNKTFTSYAANFSTTLRPSLNFELQIFKSHLLRIRSIIYSLALLHMEALERCINSFQTWVDELDNTLTRLTQIREDQKHCSAVYHSSLSFLQYESLLLRKRLSLKYGPSVVKSMEKISTRYRARLNSINSRINLLAQQQYEKNEQLLAVQSIKGIVFHGKSSTLKVCKLGSKSKKLEVLVRQKLSSLSSQGPVEKWISKLTALEKETVFSSQYHLFLSCGEMHLSEEENITDTATFDGEKEQKVFLDKFEKSEYEDVYTNAYSFIQTYWKRYASAPGARDQWLLPLLVQTLQSRRFKFEKIKASLYFFGMTSKSVKSEKKILQKYFKRKNLISKGKIEAVSEVVLQTSDEDDLSFADDFEKIEPSIGGLDPIFLWQRKSLKSKFLLSSLLLCDIEMKQKLSNLSENIEFLQHPKLGYVIVLIYKERKQSTSLSEITTDIRIGATESQNRLLSKLGMKQCKTLSKLPNTQVYFMAADSDPKYNKTAAYFDEAAYLQTIQEMNSLLEEGRNVLISKKIEQLEEEITAGSQLFNSSKDRVLLNTIKQLALSKLDLLKLLKVYALIDSDSSGTISYTEFLQYLKLEDTSFMKKIFNFITEVIGGEVQFPLFVNFIGTFCLLSRKEIMNILFNFIDEARVGSLSLQQLSSFIQENNSEVYSSLDTAKQKIALILFENNEALEMQELIHLEDLIKFNQLEPKSFSFAFMLQDLIKEKVLGKSWWARKIALISSIQEPLKSSK